MNPVKAVPHLITTFVLYRLTIDLKCNLTYIQYISDNNISTKIAIINIL